MAICGCGLPACCCQPAVAGGFIYADIWFELSTHLVLFTQSSPVPLLLLQTFPFPLSKDTGGGDTAPIFSGLCVYLQFTWEVGLPPSPVEFSSLCHSQAFPLLVAGHTPPLPPSLARPGLFIYSSWRDSPPPLQLSGYPTLFVMFLYCSCCLLLSFSFYPVLGVCLSRGLC
jgi:hypothetical protein